MPATDPRVTLGAHVRARRLSLGLSVRGASRLAGIDRDTWTSMEEGVRSTREEKFAGIERALKWAPGTIEEVLADSAAGAVVDRRRAALAGHPDLVEIYDRVLRDAGLDPSDQEEVIGALLELAQLRDAQRLSSGSPN